MAAPLQYHSLSSLFSAAFHLAQPEGLKPSRRIRQKKRISAVAGQPECFLQLILIRQIDFNIIGQASVPAFSRAICSVFPDGTSHARGNQHHPDCYRIALFSASCTSCTFFIWCRASVTIGNLLLPLLYGKGFALSASSSASCTSPGTISVQQTRVLHEVSVSLSLSGERG